MIKPFNFFRGVVGARVVSVQHILDELYEVPEPPYGISRRHWNMLPQDLKGGEREDMETYIEGWEAARHANYNNPHPDQPRAEVWNRGFHAWWVRRNREDVP